MQRHFIQQNILKELLKKPESTFTELNTNSLSSDHFNFHLKQLLRENLITKTGNLYTLSATGMEEAGRIDIVTGSVILQPKIGVTLGVFRNNDREVLLVKRTRSQSFGQYAWLDRKMRMGSSFELEISALLEEEAGLKTNNYLFCGVTHVIRMISNKIEIDTVQINFKISEPTGELKIVTKDGVNSWLEVEKVKNLESKEKVSGMNERLEAFLKNQVILQEII